MQQNSKHYMKNLWWVKKMPPKCVVKKLKITYSGTSIIILFKFINGRQTVEGPIRSTQNQPHHLIRNKVLGNKSIGKLPAKTWQVIALQQNP